MPKQALYLKWRPQTFEDVVGQEHITRTLRNALKSGRIRHAYLFSGPRGTGKTTTARLLAKAVNCTDPDTQPCNACPTCVAINEGRFLDLIEIDAATHTGVDDVRELRDKIAFAPGEGRYKVYIIDEVHRFSGSAFDALLKTLEEPPNHAIFVLATTEIERVPETIKSRCLQFEFRRISMQEVADRLAHIATSEGLKFEKGAMELIARHGTGSARDSISLLDQIVADPEEVITLELVQRILGAGNVQAVRDLVDAIIMQETGRGLHIINSAVDAGSDPRQFGRQVVEHLRAVLLTQTASADLVEASAEERRLFAEQAQRISRKTLLRAIRVFNEAVNVYTGGWQPQLSLELALIESAQPEPEPEVVTAGFVQSQQAGAHEAVSQSYERAEATPPGSPPLLPPDVISKKWIDAQKVISPHSTQLAALMDYARLLTVDGNQLVMAVEQPTHLNLLNKRVSWVERALEVVHGVKLRVRFVLDTGEKANASMDEIDDPVIRQALELGGEIETDNE